MEGKGKGMKRPSPDDPTETKILVFVLKKRKTVEGKVEGGTSSKHPINRRPDFVYEPPKPFMIVDQDLEDIDLEAITKSSSSTCKQPKSEEGDFGVDITQEASALHLSQSFPIRSNSIDQSMKKSGEEGWRVEYGNGRTYLVRACLDGSTEYTYHKAVVINRPGIVAAVGGIPQKLKIKDGISFSIPSPIFKCPGDMPEDPTQDKDRYNVMLHKIYKNAMESDAFINAFIKAYTEAKLKALGVGVSQEEEPHNRNHQSPTFLEFNIAATPGWYCYLRSIPSDPILRKSDLERNEDVKAVYIRENSIPQTLLYRHLDDSLEVVYLAGVICNAPSFVAVVGGIPNELKIKGARTLWILSPIFKFPKQYPSKNKQVKYVGLDKLKLGAFVEAYKQTCSARHASSSSTSKQNIEVNPWRPMVEVNFVLRRT